MVNEEPILLVQLFVDGGNTAGMLATDWVPDIETIINVAKKDRGIRQIVSLDRCNCK